MIYNFQFCETVSLPPKELAGDGPSQGGRYFLMFDQEREPLGSGGPPTMQDVGGSARLGSFSSTEKSEKSGIPAWTNKKHLSQNNFSGFKSDVYSLKFISFPKLPLLYFFVLQKMYTYVWC